MIVTDTNGNFDQVEDPAILTELGITTWSAFKNPRTQGDLDALYTNPWRPSSRYTPTTMEPFVTHAAGGPIYIAGHGNVLTRNFDRFERHLQRDLGLRIQLADPRALVSRPRRASQRACAQALMSRRAPRPPTAERRYRWPLASAPPADCPSIAATNSLATRVPSWQSRPR